MSSFALRISGAVETRRAQSRQRYERALSGSPCFEKALRISRISLEGQHYPKKGE
jgi:hypothetical protein